MQSLSTRATLALAAVAVSIAGIQIGGRIKAQFSAEQGFGNGFCCMNNEFCKPRFDHETGDCGQPYPRVFSTASECTSICGTPNWWIENPDPVVVPDQNVQQNTVSSVAAEEPLDHAPNRLIVKLRDSSQQANAHLAAQVQSLRFEPQSTAELFIQNLLPNVTVEDAKPIFGKELPGGTANLVSDEQWETRRSNAPWQTTYVVTLQGDEHDIPTLAAEMSGNSAVEYAEPDYIVTINQSQEDPLAGSLWGMQKLAVQDAWNHTTGKPVVVAVIDTGVDMDHVDLAANIWTNHNEKVGNNIDEDANGKLNDIHGYDYVNFDTDPDDDQGHGTHVAGTIAAIANNAQHVYGVAPDVQIIPLKVLDENGSGFISDIASAVYYASYARADVMNLSLGGYNNSTSLEFALNTAEDIFNVIAVAAAGNEGLDVSLTPHYPSSYDYTISVAATDQNDARAFFSNYGSTIDIAAPGLSIVSTTPNNQTDSFSGTSMASPHVAGVVALLRAMRPELTRQNVVALLRDTGDSVAASEDIGGKRVHARSAVEVLLPDFVHENAIPSGNTVTVDVVPGATVRVLSLASHLGLDNAATGQATAFDFNLRSTHGVDGRQEWWIKRTVQNQTENTQGMFILPDGSIREDWSFYGAYLEDKLHFTTSSTFHPGDGSDESKAILEANLNGSAGTATGEGSTLSISPTAPGYFVVEVTQGSDTDTSFVQATEAEIPVPTVCTKTRKLIVEDPTLSFEDYYNWGSEKEYWFNGTNGNWYFLKPDGGLYLWGSASLDDSFLLNTFPTSFWQAIRDVDEAGGTKEQMAEAAINVINWRDCEEDDSEEEAPDPTYECDIDALAALAFNYNTNDYKNWGGLQERWIQANSDWYFMLPDGAFHKWDGKDPLTPTEDSLHTRLHPDFYADDFLLSQHYSLLYNWQKVCKAKGAAPVAKLLIAQKITGTSGTAVERQQDLTLLRFEARAEEASVYFKKLIFASAQGSVYNGQNYSLWVDRNGDGTVDAPPLQQGVSAASDAVTFNDIASAGNVVSVDNNTVFEVHADIASSLWTPTVPNYLQLQFSSIHPYIDAKEIDSESWLEGIVTNDGDCISQEDQCQIVVQTADSKLFALHPQGDLYVYYGENQQMSLPHQVSEFVLALKADVEPVEVTDLQIEVTQSTSEIVLDRLHLTLPGQETPIAVMTKSACGSSVVSSANTYCANMESQELVIPVGQQVTVNVVPVNYQGVFRLKLGSSATLANNRGTVQARGTISNNSLVRSNGNDVAEGEIHIGRSIPCINTDMISRQFSNLECLVDSVCRSFEDCDCADCASTPQCSTLDIRNANVDSDGTAVPTGVSEVAAYTILSDSQHVLDKITFSVDARNIEFDDNIKFYAKFDQTKDVPCTIQSVALYRAEKSSFHDIVRIECDDLSRQFIDAAVGPSLGKTFVLQMNITNARLDSTESSRLQVFLDAIVNSDGQTLTIPNAPVPSTSYGFSGGSSSSPPPGATDGGGGSPGPGPGPGPGASLQQEEWWRFWNQ